MAHDPPTDDSPAERRMTTDPERIREWAEANDAVPVTIHGGEGHGATFAREGDLESDHEEYTWEEFEATFADEDLVFVYHESDTESGDDLSHFELVEREAAFERADLGSSELEDQLRRGETVTTEIVETQVIEREIVERDTIESEVVDTEIADRHVVDSELVDRDIGDIEFVSADMIEVTTDETRLDTVEEVERYTVESRVVDVDVEQDEQLERDEVRTDVELETVQRSIVESDVVRADVSPNEIVERQVIESKRGEGDTVRSELIERRTLEEEIEEQTRMRFTLEETELLESEVVSSRLLEGDIVDVEEYETITAEERATATDPESGEAAGLTDDAETTAGGEPSTATDAGAETEARSGPTVDREVTSTVSPDDQGKVVVDESGEEIGIAARIEAETVYVDPEPGLTDRLKARLGWHSEAEDEYPVDAEQIRSVEGDEIVLRSE